MSSFFSYLNWCFSPPYILLKILYMQGHLESFPWTGYFCDVREANKHGKTQSRHSEAQAILAASPPCVASSSRNAAVQKQAENNAVPVKQEVHTVLLLSCWCCVMDWLFVFFWWGCVLLFSWELFDTKVVSFGVAGSFLECIWVKSRKSIHARGGCYWN